MGIGDELMAAGQARRAMAHDPRRVRIVERDGVTRRWHPIWDRNPRLARPEEEGDFQILVNGPGCRPYIAAKTARKWIWKDFACPPGEIWLSPEEQAFGVRHAGRIVIEPTLKPRASPNKLWTGWRDFAQRAHAAGLCLTQLGTPGVRPLQYAELIPTPSFRHAAAVLSGARAYVGHEGGLHHAAAAVGTPAIVLFGGFIGPAQTGYVEHRNLTGGAAAPCGMRVPCHHCRAAMDAITPAQVLNELRELLNGT